MGCLEFQLPYGAVIQSVFDHSRLLIRDNFHALLIGNELAQQTIEVLVAIAVANCNTDRQSRSGCQESDLWPGYPQTPFRCPLSKSSAVSSRA